MQAGCHTLAGVLPDQIGEPRYLTDLHYYDVLTKMLDKQQQSDQEQSQQPGGEPGKAGEGAPSGGWDQEGDEQQPQTSFKGCGSGSGGQAAPCELPTEDTMNGAAPAVTDVEKWRYRVATAAAIAKEASRGRGSVPGHLIEQAEQLLTPSTTPWQRLLGSKIRRAYRRRSGTLLTDYTRRDRHRHEVLVGGRKILFPGRSKPRLRVACVRDTSGSMGNRELAVAINEVVAIAKRLHIRGPELLVIDVDHAVHATTGFTGFRSVQQVKGRGGTDMRLGIDHAMGLAQPPDIIVVLTDGGTPWPEEPSPVPLIACLIGPYAEDSAARVPGWMEHLVVEEPILS